MTEAALSPIDACVFDAYGTLFDVHAAAARCRDALGDKADALSATWRRKQLEYTWLRSLMGRHADFWQVTGDALDFALAEAGIAPGSAGDGFAEASGAGLRERLMQVYKVLDAYPEAPGVLAELKRAGFRTAILSNGAPAMLAAAVANAGIADRVDQVLSVEEVGIYKPHPSVYRLAVDRLEVPAGRICFLSANGWDAAGAAQFGFRVVWINRFGQRRERLPAEPEVEIADLTALPPLLGRAARAGR